MRRPLLVALTTLGAAAALAGAALAKEANVELSSMPTGTHPGDPWNPIITVFLDGDRLAQGDPPTLTIAHLRTGETTDFRAAPTADPGKYSARVVFPESGLYSVEVHDAITGRTYPFPTVYVPEAPASARPATPAAPTEIVAPRGGSDSFPLWPVLGGALGALAAALAFLFTRSARPRASARVRSEAPAPPAA